MVRQGHSNGLSPDSSDDSALHHLGGDQADRPPRVSVGRWSAYQRDDRSFLDAVELPRAARSRIIGERRREAALQVSLQHSPGLAVVPADGVGGRLDRQACVEVLQRQDPSPGSRRQLLAAGFHAAQLASITGRERQPRRALRFDLHPNA